MNFSEAVKLAMDAHNMSKADLARATKYSYQYISDLLVGKRRWHEVVINKVCEALGIKIEIIFEVGEGESGEQSSSL
ncbi:helix-turn-helix transcriptional regulator [Paenibacillus cisolokensis]|uniref:helix-turn-helix domain-containing protein n=1 Tax=Paenibacillus cisolokensis TaxID=1658519 RepID=UPI003D29B476